MLVEPFVLEIVLLVLEHQIFAIQIGQHPCLQLFLYLIVFGLL